MPVTLPSALSFSRCACTCQPAASTSCVGQVGVAVERRDDVADLRGPLLHELEDLLLALLAVLDVLVDARLGLLDHVAVAGADPRQAQLLEPLERLRGRRPCRRRGRGFTTEYMPSSTVSPVNSTRSSSSRKQRWLGAWPGRVQHVEAELGALDRVALADDPIGDDVAVLVGAALREREHLGAGLPSRAARCRASGRGGCA